MISCNILRDIINISNHSLRIAYKKIHQSQRQQQQNQYHLHTNFRIIRNLSRASPLVKMYVFCRRVSTWKMRCYFLRHSGDLKKCYLIPMFLARGVIFMALAAASAPLFSSKTVDLITEDSLPPILISVAIYKSRRFVRMSSRITWINTVYSASVVLSAI